jgi:hypothetical protein
MTPVSKMFSPQFFKESLSNVGIVNFGGNIFTEDFPVPFLARRPYVFLTLSIRDQDTNS